MSKLFKREDSPYWWYSAGDYPNRIRKSTKIKDRRVATRIQDKWDQELALKDAGLEVITVDLSIPFKEYIDVIELNKKKKNASCIRSALNMFMELSPDNITNKHLTSFFLQEYFAKRKAMGRSPKTIQEDHKYIHGWCIWMVAMGYMTHDPTKDLIRPTLFKVRPRKDYTREEIKYAFKEAWLEHDRIFWNVLYKTGLRAVNGCTLTPDNINGKFIEVSQNKTLKYDNQSVVVVPIHIDLQTMDIFNIMNPNSIGNSRERLKKILGHGDLHTLRHSFATHLENFYGATHQEVEYLLGHKAGDVTSTYVHMYADRLAPIINQL
jgi:site-specific recombinase XerD